MKLSMYVLNCIFFLAAAGCKNDEFKKGQHGMEYKFFKLGEGQEVQPGNWLKLQMIQKYNDSVLRDTHKGKANYFPFDSTILSKETYAIMRQVSVGDSLVFKVVADSEFKDQKKPPFVKKGGYMYTYIKVENIFRSMKEYQAEINPGGQTQQQGFGQQGRGFGQQQNGGFNQGQEQHFGSPQEQGGFGQQSQEQLPINNQP